jgi:hypothetical protein
MLIGIVTGAASTLCCELGISSLFCGVPTGGRSLSVWAAPATQDNPAINSVRANTLPRIAIAPVFVRVGTRLRFKLRESAAAGYEYWSPRKN